MITYQILLIFLIDIVVWVIYAFYEFHHSTSQANIASQKHSRGNIKVIITDTSLLIPQ